MNDIKFYIGQETKTETLFLCLEASYEAKEPVTLKIPFESLPLYVTEQLKHFWKEHNLCSYSQYPFAKGSSIYVPIPDKGFIMDKNMLADAWVFEADATPPRVDPVV